jgi:hypothetical protein
MMGTFHIQTDLAEIKLRPAPKIPWYIVLGSVLYLVEDDGIVPMRMADRRMDGLDIRLSRSGVVVDDKTLPTHTWIPNSLNTSVKINGTPCEVYVGSPDSTLFRGVELLRWPPIGEQKEEKKKSVAKRKTLTVVAKGVATPKPKKAKKAATPP